MNTLSYLALISCLSVLLSEKSQLPLFIVQFQVTCNRGVLTMPTGMKISRYKYRPIFTMLCALQVDLYV